MAIFQLVASVLGLISSKALARCEKKSFDAENPNQDGEEPKSDKFQQAESGRRSFWILCGILAMCALYINNGNDTQLFKYDLTVFSILTLGHRMNFEPIFLTRTPLEKCSF